MVVLEEDEPERGGKVVEENEEKEERGKCWR